MYKHLIPGLFLVLFTVSAFAAVPTFEEVDADKNGAISHAEALTAGISEEAFIQADVNRDTKLSPDEYKVFLEPSNG